MTRGRFYLGVVIASLVLVGRVVVVVDGQQDPSSYLSSSSPSLVDQNNKNDTTTNNHDSAAVGATATSESSAGGAGMGEICASIFSSAARDHLGEGDDDTMINGLDLINGTHLSLLVALPLSFKGTPVLSPGYLQLATALMAIDHFNERNSWIVPELDSMENCPIRIDTTDSLIIMDTGTIQNNGMNTIIESIANRQVPHAIVGPYNEIPATELSVIASYLRIPLVSHRGLDHNLLLPEKHPMVTQVNPDLYAEVDFLGDYLQHTGRVNYISVLYASSSDSAIQRLEAFRGVAQMLNMTYVQAFGYVSPGLPNMHNVVGRPVQTIDQAMTKMAATGYRTIVWITNDIEADLESVGEHAHNLGLDRGDHMWVLGSSFELSDRPLAEDDTMFNISTTQLQNLVAYLRHNQTTINTQPSDDNTNDNHNDNNENLPLVDIREMMMKMQYDDAGGEDEKSDNNNPNPYHNIQFLFNAAFLRQFELEDERSWKDSNFMKSWFQLNNNRTFLERMQQLNPIAAQKYQKEWEQIILYGLWMGWMEPNNIPDVIFPPKDLFSNPKSFFTAPTSGSVNLYDSIMSVGLGACRAYANATTTAVAAGQKKKQQHRQQPEDRRHLQQQQQEQQQHPTMTGEMLQVGIRSVDFNGASGPVRFGDGFPGSRARDSITYSVFNMFPQRSFRKPFQLTEYRTAADGLWRTVEAFVYADNSTTPPLPLRDPADENYLSDGVRIAGLSLASVAFLVVLLSGLWIVMYRHHAVVVASQPLLLFFMCLANTMNTAAIVLLSFDESHGLSVEALSGMCIAIPWLVTFGHIVTYNMLFTKLWRVNRVLQFSRRKVDIKHVIWPAALMETVAFVVLSIWTATTDYGYVREELDNGQSFGRCVEASDEVGFWIPIVLLSLIPMLLTAIFSWKTIDVDAAYSEARWIFALILVQCQVIVVGLPLVVILNGVSTDGRYLGQVLILWTFPMTTIGLIMVPKMVAVHCPLKEHRDTRGSSGGVRVTGIGSSTTDRYHQCSHPLESSVTEPSHLMPPPSSLSCSVQSHQVVIQH